jgi:nucleoside phosphorylase
MSYLQRTRQLLKQYLQTEYSLAEIESAFQKAGFRPLTTQSWRRGTLVDHYYAQRDWSRRSEAEALFGVTFQVLQELKKKNEMDIAGGQIHREKFRRILVDGVRHDGAELYDDRVSWKRAAPSRQKTSGPDSHGRLGSTPTRPKPSDLIDGLRQSKAPRQDAIDLLLVTALTEEQQVVVSVLDSFVGARVDRTDRADRRMYRVLAKGQQWIRVGVVSAHQMGAVSLGIFVAPLLKELRPKRAILVGIAAAVDTSEVGLGDVPFGTQVLSYDDIAVESGVLIFRSEGFQADPTMRRWVGALRTSRGLYVEWQRDCSRTIRRVVKSVNLMRRQPIVPPTRIVRPHLIAGIVAGGPFLLRDRGMREALTKSMALPAHNRIKVAAPLHPKLLSAEMEAHGFMRAAHEAGIPAAVFKGISDIGDKDKARLERETGGFYRAYACSNAVLAVIHAIHLNVTLD